jgi:hypothetical protein
MKLDGAGSAKMATLDDAIVQTQRLHTIVERMALAVRAQEDVTPMYAQMRRSATPLVGLLKGQYGMIADHVTAMILIATRPGGSQMKVRSLRESVAQLRTQLDIAVTRVREKHAIEDAK